MFSGHVGKTLGNAICLLCPVAWINKELQESKLSNSLTCGCDSFKTQISLLSNEALRQMDFLE